MVEPGADMDLLEKSPAPSTAAASGRSTLSCHFAIVLQIPGEIDRGHAARTKLTLDSRNGHEGGGETGQRTRHGCAPR